jgi:hypothetical protein
MRYAIVDPAYPETDLPPKAEDTQVIHLLGGLAYPVQPVFLKSRHTPTIPKKQDNQCLQSRNTKPTKQEKEILESRNTKLAETPRGEAPEVSQEVLKKVIQERTEEGPVAPASVVDPQALPRIPASAPAAPPYEAVLETLHASAAWKADAGKDLLLLRHLQAYPVEWLAQRATDYAFTDGTHSYQGFKNWCQSPRAQEKLRLWEQAQRARALRAAPPPGQLLSRKAQEEEEARIVAERNARSRARFGRQASHD